jgi:acetyl-CoA carboxylase carboxyl transferase subunit alpha
MANPSFDAPLEALQQRIDDVAAFPGDPEKEKEAVRLRAELDVRRREIYSSLTPWQTTQVARHPARPYTLDYINALCEDFVELHGDRRFGEDAALVCGFARFEGRPVAVIGHQKGRGTKQMVHRNFGMPNPEGYRKATRLYHLAERFRLPVITMIDTPGAFPGIEAEERGQSEAIASALEVMAGLTVPIVTTVIGEGGSGGALALGVANRVLVLEFSYYSVISPEGCAAILWKDATRAPEAAERLKITAPHLLELGVVDAVVEEPPGGAHHDHDAAANMLDRALFEALVSLDGLSPGELREDRYRRFRRIGSFVA